ncbi:hypothetical protein CC86DRAFT_417931 [Ophiobolus disseminans]|uniref:Uncharacterized protein n=1 Tax=Ophiobolus disseminans TaxID=1469910 RepID=A0A6A6ZYI5_9PLEO|nr:hypothetical protein CC86DRAFT_417931 [Ophiobolus disseminans]
MESEINQLLPAAQLDHSSNAHHMIVTCTSPIGWKGTSRLQPTICPSRSPSQHDHEGSPARRWKTITWLFHLKETTLDFALHMSPHPQMTGRRGFLWHYIHFFISIMMSHASIISRFTNAGTHRQNHHDAATDATSAPSKIQHGAPGDATAPDYALHAHDWFSTMSSKMNAGDAEDLWPTLDKFEAYVKARIPEPMAGAISNGSLSGSCQLHAS